MGHTSSRDVSKAKVCVSLGRGGTGGAKEENQRDSLLLAGDSFQTTLVPLILKACSNIHSKTHKAQSFLVFPQHKRDHRLLQSEPPVPSTPWQAEFHLPHFSKEHKGSVTYSVTMQPH